MNRRTLLKSLGAIALFGLKPLVALAKPVRKYGYSKAPDRRVKKVYVDGMDVTKVAFEFNDIEGWVRVQKWQGFPNPPGDEARFVRRNRMENVALAESWPKGKSAMPAAKPRSSLVEVVMHGNVEIETNS